MINLSECQPKFLISLKFFKRVAFSMILLIMQHKETKGYAMNKILIRTLAVLLIALPAFAQQQQVSYVEEMQFLGAVSGLGLGCNAAKYQTYELLARAILITKAKSDSEQAEGMKAYNDYKASAFISNVNATSQECARINDRFNQQKIFKATLYGDGTIKMPDGQILKPRHPYDATQVYKKDPQVRAKYIKLYNAKKAKIANDPNYQRALNEQKRKDTY
jgi:hypothetical protein